MGFVLDEAARCLALGAMVVRVIMTDVISVAIVLTGAFLWALPNVAAAVAG